MTGPSLDLDALRLRLALDRLEAAAIFDEIEPGDRDLIIRETRAVLALVEEQRERISTLEEALRRADRCHGCGGTGVARCICDGQTCRPHCRSGEPCPTCDATGLGRIARAALAGSPVKDKE